MRKWKTIEAAPRYRVSDHGDVVSLCSGRERPVKQFVQGSGYYQVQLFKAPGDHFKALVHRLVAKAFIPNPDSLPQVNHKDGNKLNNAVENLEWVSASDNIRHAYAIGLQRPAYKAPDGAVEALKRGVSAKEVAAKFSINPLTARRLRDRIGAPVWRRNHVSHAREAEVRKFPGSIRECARHFGLSKSVVHRIRSGS